MNRGRTINIWKSVIAIDYMLFLLIKMALSVYFTLPFDDKKMSQNKSTKMDESNHTASNGIIAEPHH